MGISVKLAVFEGPLDLLLHLIDKNKIDIYDIPIVEITKQYLEYVDAMRKNDLNVMSEFLLTAAILLDIKCKMLLPKEESEAEEEGDPRQELVVRLLQYKMYKQAAEELRKRQTEGGRAFYRPSSLPSEIKEYEEPVDMDKLLEGVDSFRLGEIFREVVRRREDKTDPVGSKFGKIEREEVTLSDKLIYIKEYAKKRKSFSFRELLEEQSSKTQVVVTFLAILEMMRTGAVKVSQERPFEDIVITAAA